MEDLKGKVNALEETIAKAKARQDEIRKELDGRRRGGNDTESNEIRKQLQALRNEFQQVLVRLTNIPLCAGRHAALKYHARVDSLIATHTHVAEFSIVFVDTAWRIPVDSGLHMHPMMHGSMQMTVTTV